MHSKEMDKKSHALRAQEILLSYLQDWNGFADKLLRDASTIPNNTPLSVCHNTSNTSQFSTP
jgi:hypothetical protein